MEHLHLELELHGVPHEIVVVDDGSTDATWAILQDLGRRMPELAPMQNLGPNGFGRAIIDGLDHATGDAVVIMMADESDDCRDVVATGASSTRAGSACSAAASSPAAASSTTRG